ncbi:MAG: T9SS type A sorting domain-containing protein [Bacteroidales bacterium]
MQSKSYLFFFLLIIIMAPAYNQQFFYTGNTADLDTTPEFGILLAGGGSDNDDGMQWLATRANGGDVVVLRASGSDGYNDYIYSELGVDLNSVTSILIVGSDEADTDTVCQTVANAEMIFIAGGDQWYYYDEWKNTCLQAALNSHVSDMKPIGGTSAGLAVLGEVVYTAEEGTVVSEEALGNPYHNRVTLANDFLEVPFMGNIITDSHYHQRNREGRHMAFLARIRKDWDMPAFGIGVNEYTAVAVDENGFARVYGDPDYEDNAYFLRSNALPEVCENGEPLHWDNNGQAVTAYVISGNHEANNLFDLNSRHTGIGGEWQYWTVINGELSIETDVDVSVPAANQEKQVVIFPNPAEEQLNIRLKNNVSEEKNLLLQIKDITGKTVTERKMNMRPVFKQDISWLTPGIYMIFVRSKDYLLAKEVIIKKK